MTAHGLSKPDTDGPAASLMQRIIEDAVLKDTFRMRHRSSVCIGLAAHSVEYSACSHLWVGTWLSLIAVPFRSENYLRQL